jgi:hypothetical protein
MGLDVRILGTRADVDFALPSNALQHAMIQQTMRIYALERTHPGPYVEARYPYSTGGWWSSRWRIPLEQKVRPRESVRWCAGRSATGSPSGCAARNEGGPTEAFQRAIIREWPRLSALFSDSRAAAHGYINGPAFVAGDVARAARGGREPAQMHRTISLELWLRTLESAPGASAGRERRFGPPRHRPSLHGRLAGAV